MADARGDSARSDGVLDPGGETPTTSAPDDAWRVVFSSAFALSALLDALTREPREHARAPREDFGELPRSPQSDHAPPHAPAPSLLFAPGARMGQLVGTVIEELRTIESDVLHLREALAPRAVAENERTELRRALDSAVARRQALIRRLPLSPAWKRSLVGRMSGPADEWSRARDDMDSLASEAGVALRDLRHMLRQSREGAAEAARVAQQLGTSVDEVKQLDRRMRAAARDLDAALERLSPGETDPAKLVEALRALRGGDAPPVSPAARPALGPRETLLLSAYALPRLLGAIDAVRNGRKRPDDVLGTSATESIQTAVSIADDLRDASAEFERLRGVLVSKKLSETGRRELRAKVYSELGRMVAAVNAIPLSPAWIARVASGVHAAGEELEAAERALSALAARVDVPATEMRRALREARKDEEKRNRLAAKWRVEPAEIVAMDAEARAAARRRLHATGDLEVKSVPEALALVQAARSVPEFAEPSPAPVARQEAVRVARVTGLAIDVQAVTARLKTHAAALAPTFVTAEIRADGGRNRVTPRNVALSLPRARRATAGAVEEPRIQATTGDIGQLGEELVFAFLETRWRSAAAADPGRVGDVLRRIASEYWSVDRAISEEFDRTLRLVPDAWFGSPVVRGLLWPSQTTFGDAIGFDMFGLDEAGTAHECVEVKTTPSGAVFPFELSANEYEKAKRERARYVVARVTRVLDSPPSVSLIRDPAGMMENGALRIAPSSYSVTR